MPVTITKKLTSNIASAISNVISNSCAPFGKDDKIKITTDKIKNGCNYSLHLLALFGDRINPEIHGIWFPLPDSIREMILF